MNESLEKELYDKAVVFGKPMLPITKNLIIVINCKCLSL